ncbi:AB hydrolase-1 domain-containing protein [Entamoeba marina]
MAEKNAQYQYLLSTLPSDNFYNENMQGLVMAPFDGYEPIPMRFFLAKENPYNFTLLVFHSAGKTLLEVGEELEMLSKIFKARVVSFDYPGYGMNKNLKDTPLIPMIDSCVSVMNEKGIRNDRLLLLGFEHGCGVSLEFAKVLAERKKEELSTDSSGIVLFYPVDTVELGFDYRFENFFNSTQNVTYFRVLMIIPKKDKMFHSVKQLKKIQKEIPGWKERVFFCHHDFSRLKPSALTKAKILKITDLVNPWFRKLDAQITKNKISKINISMALTTVMKTSKKTPPLPSHNYYYVENFLNKYSLDGLIPVFQDKKIYSMVHVIMTPSENLNLLGEDQDLVNELMKCTRSLKPLITKDWEDLRTDLLCETFSRIDNSTNLLDKKTKSLQSTKKVEVPDVTIIQQAADNDGVSISEKTIITVGDKRIRNPNKTKTVGGATSNKFVVPKWAENVEIDFSVFIKQPINFSDYFHFKKSHSQQN